MRKEGRATKTEISGPDTCIRLDDRSVNTAGGAEPTGADCAAIARYHYRLVVKQRNALAGRYEHAGTSAAKVSIGLRVVRA